MPEKYFSSICIPDRAWHPVPCSWTRRKPSDHMWWVGATVCTASSAQWNTDVFGWKVGLGTQ